MSRIVLELVLIGYFLALKGIYLYQDFLARLEVL